MTWAFDDIARLAQERKRVSQKHTHTHGHGSCVAAIVCGILTRANFKRARAKYKPKKNREHTHTDQAHARTGIVSALCPSWPRYRGVCAASGMHAPAPPPRNSRMHGHTDVFCPPRARTRASMSDMRIIMPHRRCVTAAASSTDRTRALRCTANDEVNQEVCTALACGSRARPVRFNLGVRARRDESERGAPHRSRNETRNAARARPDLRREQKRKPNIKIMMGRLRAPLSHLSMRFLISVLIISEFTPD